MQREEVFRLLLREDVGLPALPEVLTRLDRLLRVPDVDLRTVADLASSDAVLAGQIVRMANSAYYARGSNHVSGLASAIHRMGLRALRGLVYALTLPRSFPRDGGFPSRLLWRHSLAVAALSSEIAGFLGLEQTLREEAWLSGLVHDIGALALSTIAPEEYAELMRQAAGAARSEAWTEYDFVEMEHGRFGTDHAEVGCVFLRDRWLLPSPMPEVAAHHHDLAFSPDLPEGTERSTIHLVHVANGICSGFGVDWNPCESGRNAFRESAWEALGLDLGKVEELVARAKTSVDLAEEMLSGGG